MGTDIHGVVQRLDHGRWRTVTQIIRDRNYLLFSVLAGVRCHNDGLAPVQECRGLPADFWSEGEIHFWEEGADDHKQWLGDHSYGWATLKEVEDWPHWDLASPFGRTWREDVGTPFWTWLAYLRARFGADSAMDDGSELRIVFGFDS